MQAPEGSVLDRLAGAPVSWGVNDVPNWGVTLPPERVLSEMQDLGLKASELGVLGYLGDKPAEVKAKLERFGLGCVGGFVALPLWDERRRHETEQLAERAAHLLAGTGGTYFVTAVVTDEAWSAPFEPGDEHWRAIAEGLELVGEVCERFGLRQVLHPHVGTLVESARHIAAILERCEVAFCLDTGHFSIGGADPMAFARQHAGRVGLVHLKDVDLSLAPAVLEHKIGMLEATRAGLFRPLGQGSVDIAGTVAVLEAAGYSGWYVLEQDTAIDEADADSADPASEVAASIDYLRRVTGR
jgi:inosose dehydratase